MEDAEMCCEPGKMPLALRRGLDGAVNGDGKGAAGEVGNTLVGVLEVLIRVGGDLGRDGLGRGRMGGGGGVKHDLLG